MIPLNTSCTAQSVSLINETVQQSSAPEANVQGSSKSYNPRYKCEDRASAIFYEEGLTDNTGKIDRYLATIPEIPLNDEERARLERYFNVFFETMGSWESLRVQITAKDVLMEIFGAHGNVFDEIEIIGSAAFQALGVSFCKRFVEHLLGEALNHDKERIAKIAQRLFTPEFEAYLNARFTKPLADIDMRLTAEHASQKQIASISRSTDACIIALLKKLPMLSEKNERERRLKALEILKAKVPALDWEWVNVNNPHFYQIILRNLAFNKWAVSTKEGELLGIVNIGNPTETTVDFVFALQLPRSEIFPAVRIPCRSLLDPARKDERLYATGEHWVQAFVDKMCGRVRPDITKATEDDLKMLICYKTKGEINPVEGSEKALIDIAKRESLNFKNKTVRKVLKKHRELSRNLHEVFPYFVAQLLKEAADTHMDKDKQGAIAMTINAIDMLRGTLTTKEMRIFITEMQEYWAGPTSNHLLYHFAYLIGEDNLLESNMDIIHQLPLIKLCAFLRCQAPMRSGEMEIYPRQNAGQPSLEVVLKGEKRNYSLLLTIGNTSDLLKTAVKYLHLPRTETSSITRLLTASQTTFEGPWSSPMLDDLAFLGHQPESYENSCARLLQHEPLLGTLLFFATQTQVGNAIPLDTFLTHLPRIACKMNGHLDFLRENLTRLLETDEQKRVLNQLIAYINDHQDMKESQIAEQWISHLASIREWIPLAHQCLINFIHQDGAIDHNDKARIAQNLYEGIRGKDQRYTLRLLQFIVEKQYVSLDQLVSYFQTARDFLLAKIDVPTFAEDLHRLEKIVEESRKGRKLKPQEITQLREMIAPLVSHSRKLNALNQSFDRIQRLEETQESSEELPLPEDRYERLEELAETDYEEAADIFFHFGQSIYSQNANRLLPIMQRVLQQACTNKNYVLTLSLLKNRTLHEYFAIRPENYCQMLLAFADECYKNKLTELAETTLGVILSIFLPNETLAQTPDAETLIRIVEKALYALRSESYSDHSDYLRRMFIKGFDSLFTSLYAKSLQVEGVRLYHAAHQLGETAILQKFAPLIIDQLVRMRSDESNMLRVMSILDALIPTLAHFAKDIQKYDFFEVIIAMLIYNKTHNKVKFYLDHLFSIDSLKTKDDLELLYELFDKFKQAHPEDALALLGSYSGPAYSISEIEHSSRYLAFIARLVENQQWQHAGQALAVNPFIWSDAEKNALLHQYAIQAIEGMLKNNKLSLQELKWIFTILKRHEIKNARLICACIAACEGMLDVSLANLMWWVFTNRLMGCGEVTLHQEPRVLLDALKLREKPDRRASLNSRQIVEFIAVHTSAALHLEIFRGLLKANASIIKEARVADRPALLKELEVRVSIWLNAFWPNPSDNKALACLEIAEYYLNSTEAQMVPHAAEHFRKMDQVPEELDERFDRILCGLVAAIPKSTTPPIREKTLAWLLNAALDTDISFVLLGKCLSKCRTEELTKVGIKILSVCLSTPTYTISEIKSLRSFEAGAFLRSVIAHTEPEDLYDVLNPIFKEKHLSLYLSKEEFFEITAAYCNKILHAGVALAKSIEHFDTKLLFDAMFTTTVFLKSVELNDKATLSLYITTIVDLWLGEKGFFDKFLKDLLENIRGPDGLERVLLIANKLFDYIYAVIKQKGAETEDVFFLMDLLNDKLLSLINLNDKDLTKNQLEEIKKWVTRLLCLRKKTITQKTIEFVNELKLGPKHSLDRLEFKITLMIISRSQVEECLHVCRAQSDDACTLMIDVIKRYRDLAATLYLFEFCEDCAFILKNFKTVKSDKEQKLIDFVTKIYFNFLPAVSKPLAGLKDIMPSWTDACEKYPGLIASTLGVYIDKLPEQSFELFQIRLLGILHHMTKADVKLKEAFHITYIAIEQFCEKLIQDLTNMNALEYEKAISQLSSGQAQAFREGLASRKREADFTKNIEQILKDALMLYFDFFVKANKHYGTPEDTLVACEQYAILLNKLLEGLNRNLITKNKRFIEQTLANLDFLLAQISDCPQELKHRYQYVKETSRPKLQKGFADLFKKFRRNIK
jgi:hypothetical protein